MLTQLKGETRWHLCPFVPIPRTHTGFPWQPNQHKLLTKIPQVIWKPRALNKHILRHLAGIMWNKCKIQVQELQQQFCSTSFTYHEKLIFKRSQKGNKHVHHSDVYMQFGLLKNSVYITNYDTKFTSRNMNFCLDFTSCLFKRKAKQRIPLKPLPSTFSTVEFLNIRAELALSKIFLTNYQETRTLYTLYPLRSL